MKQSYVTALKELLTHASAGEVADILKNFKLVLERRGHDRLYAQVLRAVVRELPHAHDQRPVLTVADEATAKQPEVQQAAATLNPTTPRIDIDATIIGGYRVKAGDRELDRTYKSALLSIYRNLTTQ